MSSRLKLRDQSPLNIINQVQSSCIGPFPLKRGDKKEQKREKLTADLRNTLLLEACVHMPECHDNVSKRLQLEKKANEDKLVTRRLQKKITKMFSTKSLQIYNSISPQRLPGLSRIDPESLNNSSNKNQMVKQETFQDLNHIYNIQQNKRSLAHKKNSKFMVQQQEDAENQKILQPKQRFEQFEPYEVIGPQIVGLKLVNRHSQGPLKQQQQYKIESISSSLLNGPAEGQNNMEVQHAEIEQSKQGASSCPPRRVLQDTNPMIDLFDDKRMNLRLSSWKKQRLQKRREKIKSMKYIRRLGDKCRDVITKCTEDIQQLKLQEGLKQKKPRPRGKDAIARKQSCQVKLDEAKSGDWLGLNSFKHQSKKHGKHSRDRGGSTNALLVKHALSPQNHEKREELKTQSSQFKPKMLPRDSADGPNSPVNIIKLPGNEGAEFGRLIGRLSLSSSGSLSDCGRGPSRQDIEIEGTLCALKQYTDFIGDEAVADQYTSGIGQAQNGHPISQWRSLASSRSKGEASSNRPSARNVIGSSSFRPSNEKSQASTYRKLKEAMIHPATAGESHLVVPGGLQPLEETGFQPPSLDRDILLGEGLAIQSNERLLKSHQEFNEIDENEGGQVANEAGVKPRTSNEAGLGGRARRDDALADGAQNHMGQIALFSSQKAQSPQQLYNDAGAGTQALDPRIARENIDEDSLGGMLQYNPCMMRQQQSPFEMVPSDEEEEYFEEDSSDEVESLQRKEEGLRAERPSPEDRGSGAQDSQRQVREVLTESDEDGEASIRQVSRPLGIRLSSGLDESPIVQGRQLPKPAMTEDSQTNNDKSDRGEVDNGAITGGASGGSRPASKEQYRTLMHDLYFEQNEFFQLKRNKFSPHGNGQPTSKRAESPLSFQSADDNSSQVLGASREWPAEASPTESATLENSVEGQQQNILLTSQLNRLRQVQTLKDCTLSQVSEEQESNLDQTSESAFTIIGSRQLVAQNNKLLSTDQINQTNSDRLKDEILSQEIMATDSRDMPSGFQADIDDQLGVLGPQERKAAISRLNTMQCGGRSMLSVAAFQMKPKPRSNEEINEVGQRGQTQPRILESPQEISDSEDPAADEVSGENGILDDLSKKSGTESSSQNFVIQEVDRESGGSQSNERPMTEIKFKNLSQNILSSKMSSAQIAKSGPENAQEMELLIQKTRSNQSVDKRNGGQESKRSSQRDQIESDDADSSELADSYDQEAAEFFLGAQPQNSSSHIDEKPEFERPSRIKSGKESKPLNANADLKDASNSSSRSATSSGEPSSESSSTSSLVTSEISVSESLSSKNDEASVDQKEFEKLQSIQNKGSLLQKGTRRGRERQPSQLGMDVMFSPMPKRDDIVGHDEELTDIEVFYLTEIEQQCNADLMEKLQREEYNIRQEILVQTQKILQGQRKSSKCLVKNLSNKKLSSSLMSSSNADRNQNSNDSDPKKEDAETLRNLKTKLMRHETKKQFFAFNLYKNSSQKHSDPDLFRQSLSQGSKGQLVNGQDQRQSSMGIKVQASQSKLVQFSANNLIQQAEKKPSMLSIARSRGQQSKGSASKKFGDKINIDSINMIGLNEGDISLVSSVSSQSLSSKVPSNTEQYRKLVGDLNRLPPGAQDRHEAGNKEQLKTVQSDGENLDTSSRQNDPEREPVERDQPRPSVIGKSDIRLQSSLERYNNTNLENRAKQENQAFKSPTNPAAQRSSKKPTPAKSKSSHLLYQGFEDCQQDADAAKQPNQRNISIASSTGDLRIVDSEYRGSEKKEMEESLNNFHGQEIKVDLSGDDEVAREVVEQDTKQSQSNYHQNLSKNDAMPQLYDQNTSLLQQNIPHSQFQEEFIHRQPIHQQSFSNNDLDYQPQPLLLSQFDQNPLTSTFNMNQDQVYYNSTSNQQQLQVNKRAVSGHNQWGPQQKSRQASRRGHQVARQRRQSNVNQVAHLQFQRAQQLYSLQSAGQASSVSSPAEQLRAGHTAQMAVFAGSALIAGERQNTQNLRRTLPAGSRFQGGESAPAPQRNQGNPSSSDQVQINPTIRPGRPPQKPNTHVPNQQNAKIYPIPASQDYNNIATQQSIYSLTDLNQISLSASINAQANPRAAGLGLYSMSQSTPVDVKTSAAQISTSQPGQTQNQKPPPTQNLAELNIHPQYTQPVNKQSDSEHQKDQEQNALTNQRQTSKDTRMTTSLERLRKNLDSIQGGSSGNHYLPKELQVHSVKNQISWPKKFVFSPQSQNGVSGQIDLRSRSRNSSPQHKQSHGDPQLRKMSIFSPKNQPVDTSQIMREVRNNLQSLYQDIQQIRGPGIDHQNEQSQSISGRILSPKSQHNNNQLSSIPRNAELNIDDAIGTEEIRIDTAQERGIHRVAPVHFQNSINSQQVPQSYTQNRIQLNSNGQAANCQPSHSRTQHLPHKAGERQNNSSANVFADSDQSNHLDNQQLAGISLSKKNTEQLLGRNDRILRSPQNLKQQQQMAANHNRMNVQPQNVESLHAHQNLSSNWQEQSKQSQLNISDKSSQFPQPAHLRSSTEGLPHNFDFYSNQQHSPWQDQGPSEPACPSFIRNDQNNGRFTFGPQGGIGNDQSPKQRMMRSPHQKQSPPRNQNKSPHRSNKKSNFPFDQESIEQQVEQNQNNFNQRAQEQQFAQQLQQQLLQQNPANNLNDYDNRARIFEARYPPSASLQNQNMPKIARSRSRNLNQRGRASQTYSMMPHLSQVSQGLRSPADRMPPQYYQSAHQMHMPPAYGSKYSAAPLTHTNKQLMSRNAQQQLHRNFNSIINLPRSSHNDPRQSPNNRNQRPRIFSDHQPQANMPTQPSPGGRNPQMRQLGQDYVNQQNRKQFCGKRGSQISELHRNHMHYVESARTLAEDEDPLEVSRHDQQLARGEHRR